MNAGAADDGTEKIPDLSARYIHDTTLDPWAGLLPEAERILSFRKAAAPALDRDSLAEMRRALHAVEQRDADYEFGDDVIRFGKANVLPENARDALLAMLRLLMPWRKGPFSYFGIEVDAEWRSDLKWNRVSEACELELDGRRVMDVGCNNLYYLYRIMASRPELAVGIDPMPRYYFHHQLNRKFMPAMPLHFELMGVDDLPLFPDFFHTVFFMGILYHRRNPLQSLENVALCMRKGGQLILETAGIPGEGPNCLFPGRRYMKAPGYWFLPTVDAACSMLDRTGFTDIRVFNVVEMSTEEQRRTEWAVFESLEHFLDPEDPSKTVEGFPAPIRIYIEARKR